MQASSDLFRDHQTPRAITGAPRRSGLTCNAPGGRKLLILAPTTATSDAPGSVACGAVRRPSTPVWDAPATSVSFLSIEQSGPWRQAASSMMTAKALSAASRVEGYRRGYRGNRPLGPISAHGGKTTSPPVPQ